MGDTSPLSVERQAWKECHAIDGVVVRRVGISRKTGDKIFDQRERPFALLTSPGGRLIAAHRVTEALIVIGDQYELGEVDSDQTKLRQVLLKLISNACKFISDGTVAIEAGCGDDTWLTYRVADSGIGMSSEQLGRLFQDFVQGDQTTTHRFGGTGLGLAISHRLCRLIGGAITVESREGHGSTFTVRVPGRRMVGTNTCAA